MYRIQVAADGEDWETQHTCESNAEAFFYLIRTRLDDLPAQVIDDEGKVVLYRSKRFGSHRAAISAVIRAGHE